MEAADRYLGCLIGTAIGDSLLLPAEGMSRKQIARRFPGPVRQRLVLGWGMVSDDTEHAFLTAQALLSAGTDADAFARGLARRLRWWLLGLPGGCGKATALGLLRSWCGVGPRHSGVRSAGNGPSMRAALIGLRFAGDPDRRRVFIAASTAITHCDAQALDAAQAVAEAAAWAAHGNRDSAEIWQRWLHTASDPRWAAQLRKAHDLFSGGASVDDLAACLSCPAKVTGYSLLSVPVALFAWLRHRHDPAACLERLLQCGGDTDTMGAIAGALLGIDGGPGCFPDHWRERIGDWPLSMTTLRRAGAALGAQPGRPVSWWWPLQPMRNLLFLAIIICHGLRRLLP